jgi:hypothetical protein
MDLTLNRSGDYWRCAQAMVRQCLVHADCTPLSATHTQLAKSDGRDKLLALLQYAAMFAAAGAPGNALKVQRNLGAARKPFRLLKVRRSGPGRARRRRGGRGTPYSKEAKALTQRSPSRGYSRWRRWRRCSRLRWAR